jgi:hypothetical protein
MRTLGAWFVGVLIWGALAKLTARRLNPNS